MGMFAWSTFPCSTPTGTRCTTFTTAADILGVEKSPLLVVFFYPGHLQSTVTLMGQNIVFLPIFWTYSGYDFLVNRNRHVGEVGIFCTIVPIGISIIFTFKTNYSSSGLAFYLQTSFIEYRTGTGTVPVSKKFY